MRMEWLYYGGKFYARANGDQPWREPEAEAVSMAVRDPTAEVADDEAAIEVYEIPLRTLSGRKWVEVSDGPDAEHLVHVRTNVSEEIPFPDVPSDVLRKFPERVKGIVELWIERQTDYIIQSSITLEYLRDGKSMQRLVHEAEYSLFNTAALPTDIPSS